MLLVPTNIISLRNRICSSCFIFHYSIPEKYLGLNLPGFKNLAGLKPKILFLKYI
jgi:hypothetical protein